MMMRDVDDVLVSKWPGFDCQNASVKADSLYHRPQ